MAIALKIRVSDLLAEFLADALVFFGALQAAGTVSSRPFQAFPDGLYHFFVLIQSHSHMLTPFHDHYSAIPAGVKFRSCSICRNFSKKS